MPLYEYKCLGCEERFELLCCMSQDAQAVICPACGHTGARRLMSTFSARSCGDGGGTTRPIAGQSRCGTCAGGSCATCH